MKKFVLLFAALFAASVWAQEPQTQLAPIYSVNAKYVQGSGPGYWATAGAGLTLNLTAGTVNCANTIRTYAGGTLTMTNSTTNYVYLDTTSNCAPASNTSGFTATTIPVATVITSGGAITSVTDNRTFGLAVSSTGGTGTVTTTGSPVSGNLAKFSGATSITNGDLSGDVTTSGTLAATVVKINGGSIPISATLLASNGSSQPIAASLVSADIYVGNVSNLPVAVAVSGDATLANTGALTVTKFNGGTVPTSANLLATNGSAQPVAATADSVALVLKCVAASASGTAYTCTTSPTFVPAAQDRIQFKADVANTASASLNVNSSSAATIKKTGGTTNLVANDLQAGQWTDLIYDGTNWQMQDQVGNAPTMGTVTSVTFTGDGTVLSSTPSSAVTSSGTLTAALANAGAGTVLGNNTGSAAAPAYTAAPALGVDNTTAGTLKTANGSANAHTTWGSAATTSNTILGFATAPTTGHIVDCTTSSTTCTMHDSGLVTANEVNASSPGAGVAHFAGSTQTVTSSAIVGSDMTANTVTGTQLAVVQTRRVCAVIVGADNASAVIANADLGPQGRLCFVPFAATVVEVTVAADASTPNVIPRKNSAGSGSNFVSSALATAASGGIACSNTGGTTGLDGVTTCSSTLQNTSLAAGDYIELISGTAGGTAKRMSIFVTYTVN